MLNRLFQIHCILIFVLLLFPSFSLQSKTLPVRKDQVPPNPNLRIECSEQTHLTRIHFSKLQGYAWLCRMNTPPSKFPYFQGPWVAFYKNGTKMAEGAYSWGLREGRWKAWYPNGREKREWNYQKGILHGQRLEWNIHGTKIQEMNYHYGKLRGSRKAWSEDGTLNWEAEYKRGKLNGSLTFWDKAGQPVSVSHYSKNELEGTSARYNQGKKILEGVYREGARDGRWEYLDKEGKISKVEVYKDCELQNTIDPQDNEKGTPPESGRRFCVETEGVSQLMAHSQFQKNISPSSTLTTNLENDLNGFVIPAFTYIVIELIDNQHFPASGEPYHIKCPGSPASEGFLDPEGRVIMTELPRTGDCTVSFPNQCDSCWGVLKEE